MQIKRIKGTKGKTYKYIQNILSLGFRQIIDALLEKVPIRTRKVLNMR